MIAALILAGGTGSRLGGADKAFIQLCGQPLIWHVLERLRPQVQNIAISANGEATRFSEFPLPVISDGAYAGKGPLAGLACGLQWAARQGAGSLLTVPVDTPFIPPDLAACLSPAPAVALYSGRQHHLVAHWPVAAWPGLQQFLAAGGSYKVRDFLAVCGARPVAFEGATDPFFNINTSEDLAKAASLSRA